MSIRALLVALAKVLLTSLGMAQVRAGAPDSGPLVRVTVSDKGSTHRTTGILTFQDADSIALLVQLPARGDSDAQPRTKVVAISRSAITAWEISAGRRSSARTGARIGSGVGLGIGILVVTSSKCSGSGEGGRIDCPFASGHNTAVMVGFSALGAGLGAILGAASSHEVWRPLSGQPSITLTVGRRDGRTSVGLSLRFSAAEWH
jgi:hypothetical protein